MWKDLIFIIDIWSNEWWLVGRFVNLIIIGSKIKCNKLYFDSKINLFFLLKGLFCKFIWCFVVDEIKLFCLEEIVW